MSEEIKEKILRAGIRLSHEKGFMCITRNGVTDEAGVTPSLLNYNFKTLKNLRSEIIRIAIEEDDLILVCQAIVARHWLTKELTDEQRKKALLVMM
jgi:hypothetical protein